MLNIPDSLLLALSLTALLTMNMMRKLFSKKDKTKLSGGFLFNAITGVIAALILILWDGFGSPSTYTLLFGIVFGLATAFQGVANLAALSAGPMSYTTVIVSFSAIIPSLSGALFFDEELSVIQIIGIVLMLISFALAAKEETGGKQANAKWLGLCILSFLGSGTIGVMQKIHQSSEHKSELSAFLILAFISSAIICTFLFFIFKTREKRTENDTLADITETKKISSATVMLVIIMLINGVAVTLNNKFNLYLSGAMDSAIFFPISGGGGLVLTTLAALIIFKEKLSLKQWIGVCVGIVSVVFLCNPF